MMRVVIFLSCVGTTIYALLVVSNRMMPVVPESTRIEVVARETPLKVWGPYLRNRPLKQLFSREIAAPRPPPATAYQKSSNQIGEQLTSLEAHVPAKDQEGFWFVVSRAAWVHADPSVSSPIVHAYRVGTELKVIGHEQGWFRIIDPTTSRTGWIYERYYLQAIPGPGQIQFAVRQATTPVNLALAASNPKPTRIQKQRSKQKIAKAMRDQPVRVASAQSESVADIMERAFRRN
jgi:Bacterial SH3 domain